VEKCPKATAEIRKEMHDYLKFHTQRFKAMEMVVGKTKMMMRTSRLEQAQRQLLVVFRL
jgi:hypothetical protein